MSSFVSQVDIKDLISELRHSLWLYKEEKILIRGKNKFWETKWCILLLKLGPFQTLWCLCRPVRQAHFTSPSPPDVVWFR